MGPQINSYQSMLTRVGKLLSKDHNGSIRRRTRGMNKNEPRENSSTLIPCENRE